MQLTSSVHSLLFNPVELHFYDSLGVDVFSHKNNKTVAQTITHRRYVHLRDDIHRTYADALEQPLGTFLQSLKAANDPFYLRFLNKYGDATFCSFSIRDSEVIKKRGLYMYAVDNSVRYIGRCNDNFGKRINQGYGRIHPKNCYIDGQATNCHLNALVAQNRADVTFYVHPLTDQGQIEELERHVIRALRPEWNIALKPLLNE